MAHRPNGRTSATSNFLTRLSSVRTMGDDHPDGYSSTRNFHIDNARVRTMIGSLPDGWSRIDNFLLWCTRVRTTAVRRPDGHFELRCLPYGDARPDGIPHRPNGWLIYPFLELGKKSKTDRVLSGVQTCCWNVRTDASWYRNFSIQYRVWTEWTLRPDRWCWSV
jgi:hypothetical protein